MNLSRVSPQRFRAALPGRPGPRWPSLALGLLLGAQGAFGADDGLPPHVILSEVSPPVPVGTATRGLLGLQRGGAAAAPRLPMPGPVAGAVWQRYLKSFEHPVPDLFRDAEASMKR